MIYLKDDVYTATQKRLKLIFENFENIYVSFSGGKDSGLLLSLVVQYMREHNIKKKIGVFHQDFEAQYTETTNYVTRTLLSNQDLIKPYWLCIPMACKSATSQHEQYWYTWEESKKDAWVRPMPDYDCVINLKNHQFDFYHDGITQEEIYKHFGVWYHHHECQGLGKTIGLIGIRSQESLNRWRAVVGEKNKFQNYSWTTDNRDGTFTAYPLYDWQVEDVWTAVARFGFDYNKIYDLFHYAGLSPAQMRVASPFNDWAIGSLNLYRIIEPTMWAKLLGRVKGANFCSIYGGTKAVAWKNIQLPQGHTWKSYVSFLLDTLPEQTAKTYREKFATSVEFWAKKGGVLSDSTIAELHQLGINAHVKKEKSNYKTTKRAVTFDDYPDDADVKEFASVPSYKRMAICILKNDHLCKYMGFSQTKEEALKRKKAIEKYALL